jgi:hypothetical protein
MERNKVFRAYVSTTWSSSGGLVNWIDECETEDRITSQDGRPMAWTSKATLSVLGDDWCATREECQRVVVKQLRDKAQEILDQAAALERAAEEKTADH